MDVSIAFTWFGLRHARLKVVVLQRTVVSRFGCFVFEFWKLRFGVLGAPFSSFGCFVFEVCSFSRSGCFVIRSSFSKLPCLLYQIAFRDCTFSSASQRPFLVSSGGKGEKKERSV